MSFMSYSVALWSLSTCPCQSQQSQTRKQKHSSSSTFQLSVLWEERYKEEVEKTRPLEEVCAALREELDASHRQRIEAFEIKMKPIIIRDGPSRKVWQEKRQIFKSKLVLGILGANWNRVHWQKDYKVIWNILIWNYLT